jgi:hypothetical protein
MSDDQFLTGIPRGLTYSNEEMLRIVHAAWDIQHLLPHPDDMPQWAPQLREFHRALQKLKPLEPLQADKVKTTSERLFEARRRLLTLVADQSCNSIEDGLITIQLDDATFSVTVTHHHKMHSDFTADDLEGCIEKLEVFLDHWAEGAWNE